MGLYDVDYSKLAEISLPVKLRKPKRLARLSAYIAPVIYLHNLFMQFRASSLYVMQHNGQVCYLQAMLNDTFDPILRRIILADPVYIDPVPLYIDTELKPLYTTLDSENAPIYLPTDAEINAANWDFVVLLPLGLGYDLAQMKATINKYRLPGKGNYLIQYA